MSKLHKGTENKYGQLSLNHKRIKKKYFIWKGHTLQTVDRDDGRTSWVSVPFYKWSVFGDFRFGETLGRYETEEECVALCALMNAGVTSYGWD